ncbi:hypothetical protein OUZ56_017418 [Daphnia magna]|uniref:Uncharacterized protein n=1 Tax=Daphnia magna TaxID=35525 RepID=A0ABR0ASQ9_9CRUS|nr:hypothetical protein OUZ56_017418 [Daphnia magna]
MSIDQSSTSMTAAIFYAVFTKLFRLCKCILQPSFRILCSSQVFENEYPHKVWKHDEFFRAFNTAAYGPKCLPFLRDNSRLSYRKANPKKSSC